MHALDQSELLQFVKGTVYADEAQGSMAAAGGVIQLQRVMARGLAAMVWTTARRAGVSR